MNIIMGVLILMLSLFSSTAQATDFQVWIPSKLEKIRRNTQPPTRMTEPILKLEAAQNEWEGGQLIVTASDIDLDNVSMSVSDLIHEDQVTIINLNEIKLYQQHYILVLEPTTNAFPPGWYPDALIPLEVADEIDIYQGDNQGFWLALKVPKGQKPGLYKGNILVKTNQQKLNVPLELLIWDFELPDYNHTQTAFSIWYDQVAAYHDVFIGSDEYWELLNNYYWFQTEYRLSPTDLPIPTGDVDEYLKLAEAYLDKPQVSSFRIPFYSNPEKDQEMYLSLKTRGWLNKGYYYISSIDEPVPEQYPLVKLYSKEIQNVAPEAKHVVTKEIVEELEGYVNTWCGLVDLYDHDLAQERQRQGDHVWWYTCVIPKHPFPSYHIDDHLISARLLSWMQKFYGVEGNLYWSTTIFRKWNGSEYVFRDPWSEPMAYPGANGDGYLLYPGNEYGINGPIGTIRLETIRDGLEDYEYLYLFEQRLTMVAEKLGLEANSITEKVLASFLNRLFEDPQLYNSDPHNLLNIRREIAEEIITTLQEPNILVIHANSEIIIYTEKDTLVTVNNLPLVSLEQTDKSEKFVLKHEQTEDPPRLKIIAKKGNATKEIERTVLVSPPGSHWVLGKSTQICSFEEIEDFKKWRTTNVTLSLVEEQAIEGNQALKAIYHPGVDFPNLKLVNTASHFISDWSNYKTFAFDIYNASEKTAKIYCKFYNQNNQIDDTHVINIKAKQSKTVIIPTSSITIDITTLKEIELWMWKQKEPVTLHLDNFRLILADSIN